MNEKLDTTDINNWWSPQNFNLIGNKEIIQIMEQQFKISYALQFNIENITLFQKTSV